MTHIGDRGRVVVPADLRRRLKLEPGDLLVIDVDDDDRLLVRKASDVAHGLRGYLRATAPERDLASELIDERRVEAEREAEAAARRGGAGAEL